MASCRSCGAEIVWAATVSGRAMPVEPAPVGKGNIVLDDREGQVGLARVVAVGEGTHVSHFATCPLAAKHRRKR